MNRRDMLKKSSLSFLGFLTVKQEENAKKKSKYEIVVIGIGDKELTNRQKISIEKESEIKIEFRKYAKVRGIAILKDGVCRYRKLLFKAHDENDYIGVTPDFTLNIHLDLPSLALED